MGVLPKIGSDDDYRRVKKDSAKCREAISTICRRHDIHDRPGPLFEKGSLIVAPVGSDLVVKIYSPCHPRDCETERMVLGHIHGSIGIPTPGVRFCGELDGWPYLAMDRLRGAPLVERWSRIPRDQQLRLCRETGAMLARLHGLALDGLDALRQDWDAFSARTISQDRRTQSRQGNPGNLDSSPA